MIDTTGFGHSGLTPRARTDELVVSGIDDETLVYDLQRNKAHCLNATAGLVWRHCDGRRTVQDLAALVPDGASAPLGEAVVWYALGQLTEARLLQEHASSGARRVTRADLLKAGVAGAVLLPVISSIVAPTAAHAASCGNIGQNCCGSILGFGGSCNQGLCCRGGKCGTVGC